jgi:hypothetical protein
MTAPPLRTSRQTKFRNIDMARITLDTSGLLRAALMLSHGAIKTTMLASSRGPLSAAEREMFATLRAVRGRGGRSVRKTRTRGRSAAVPPTAGRAQLLEEIRNPQTARPRGRRPREEFRRGRDFDSGTMYHLVTAGDAKVCPTCIDISNRGPYRESELDTVHPNPHGGGLIHPHCRCEWRAIVFRRGRDFG